jgi:RHS repeat-associated protein
MVSSRSDETQRSGGRKGNQVPRRRIRRIWVVLTGCVTLAVAMLPPAVQAAAPLVSPSGAGTVVIGPQAMEGNLQIHPGDSLRAGFNFTMPGSHPTATASIYNASVSLLVKCSDGSTPALAINLPAQTITDPGGSPSWYPSGDQSSSLVYQGTLTAPDLCGGLVMNDAGGATFTATFFSTDTIDKVNFRFHYRDNTSGSWSATLTGLPTPFAKTVTSATLTPALSLALAGDHSTAIPGDTITYTATVTNTGSTLNLAGDFIASDTGTATATVTSYWDAVYTSLDGTNWSPLAGAAATQAGYTATVPPPTSSGMTVSATSVAATGITYPTSGGPIIATTISAGGTATWHYTATVPLTASQAAALVDPTKVKKVRNSFHLEVSPANPNVTQPAIINVDFSGLFFGGGPSASLSGVNVTIQPPQNAVPLQFNSGNTPALATLGPGVSASVTGSFKVSVAAAKGSGQSDSAYLSALSAIEGTVLKATASASSTAPTGVVNAAPPPAVSTTEHLPMVLISKSGPASVAAGTTETNPLAINNTGGATASGMVITDTVPNGATGTVTGMPVTLAPGASGSASAAFPVPNGQPPGNLTDTASLTWQDANGNTYGPVSSSFMTTVLNSLVGATLALAPLSAGPDVPGQTQTLTATLLDRNGQPISNQSVIFNITGANTVSGTGTTDFGGNASFTYTGTNTGNDVAQATVTAPGITISSNTAAISWLKLLQPVAMAPVLGNFFANPNNSCTFDIGRGSTPVFGQTFPDILFNATASSVPHDISNVSNFTRPFTDLTVDVNGNYNGQVVAQDPAGSGQQAGAGSLINFYGEFTGNFIVNQPGDLTFRILHDDGYIIGVGNGATRVNGDLEGSPPATTPFNGYGVVAAWNTGSSGSSSSGLATIHFPAAGTYPYELDYTECGAGALFLNLLTQQFVAQTSPLSIYVGYADGLRPAGSIFPFPWNGTAGTTFEGCTSCTYDGGAIRIDNSGTTTATVDSVTVDIPVAPGVGYCPNTTHFDIWPHNLTIPAGQSLILAPMAPGTTCSTPEPFDTSDTSFYCGPDTGIIPVVNFTSGGATTAFKDTTQVLNTGGRDGACDGNESRSWQRIGGGGAAINLPVPPALSLNLTPFNLPGVTQGQNLTLTVAVMDGSGKPVVGQPVSVQVHGANTQALTGTTGPDGLATVTYTGLNAGTDTVQATAFVGGLRSISNIGTVVWLVAGGNSNTPAPSITTPSPADGSVVTKPVAVTATIAPPAGQTITTWRVFYQALDPGPAVTIASGTGAPPATLATFDPTVLSNGAYSITVEATASGGGTQDLTTTVIVFGYLKPGRYVTTYQDLNVPVMGFQMQVRRTYDSFDKEQGDFGVGWRVSLSNFLVSTNRALGAGGWIQYNTQCGLGLCLTAYRSSAPHFVSIVFPDQHTEIFDFSASGGSNIFFSGSPVYTARPGTGTTSTLVAMAADTSVGFQGDGNLYNGSGSVYDPQQFKLTTLDGTVLVLDRTVGLVSMTDRHNNSLQVSSAGVTASSGQGITFTRDASGRITQITDPASHKLTYVYTPTTCSPDGNLSSFVDANGNTTTFCYDANHNLTKANGPAGQPLQAERYDSAGRLVSITDANGNVAQITNDVPGQKQTVIDPTGRLTTVYTLDDLGDVVRQDQAFDGKTLSTTATYDSAGRPLSRIDPLGHKWAATYDASGNLLSVSDPLSHAVGVTYDSFGAPLTFTDPAGKVSSYVYDASGNLVTFTNALGQADTYTYGANGNLASNTDALNRTTTYTQDSAGNLSSIRDPLGHTSSWIYDSLGHMTSSTDAAGNLTSSTYDAAGNLLSSKDALGHVTTLTYNALNEMVSRTDALGKTTTYTYDGNRALTSATDPLGNITKYAYDAAGREVSVTDPAGGVTTYTYDGSGRLASEKDPLARVTSYSYDDAGRLTSKTLPNGGAFAFTYDAGGHQTAVSDPLGHATLSAYDADGRLVSTTDPLGKTTTYVLDALGRQTSVVDALNQTTQHSYDAAGQLVSDTDARSGVTTYGYDAAGNRTSVTDPLGHTTTYQYDVDNRVSAVVDALNRTVVPSYDALSRVTSTQLASGIVTTSTYDALGHVTATNDGLHTTSYTFDAAGRQSSMTDARGNATTYGYDAAGRQTSITDALGGKVTTAYDLAGQKTSVVNPRGDTTNFAYDALGNLQTQTDPAGKTTAYTYDLAGRQISSTDPRGIVVTNTYDGGDHLTAQNFPGGSNAFVYDALGRRTSMTDPSGSTTFGYDAVSRLTSVAAPQGTVGYTYDAAGNRTSMSQPVRGSVLYTYDAANQLIKLSDWAGNAFTFTYSPDGMPASVSRPGGVNTAYTYDGADRLTSVHHDGPSSAIAHFDYTLDANGNRTSVVSAAGSETYTLDALNRLTGVKYANGDTGAYTYDAAGNRLSSTLNGTTTSYTYDSAGRLVSAGGNSLTYDAASNVTSNGPSTFTWDWASRLSSATVGGTTSSYNYAADGTRVAATNGSATTNYVWDRATALPLLIDDGSQGYVQTDQGILEQLGASASYPLTDALGSVRAVASATASVVATANYDAFGAVRSSTGQSSIFGFTGQQTDPTGLSYLRARYYNPTTGSFLSPDSVQPNAPGTQGYGPYAYVANNPTTVVDPSGNDGFVGFGIRLTTVDIVAALGFIAITVVLREQLTQLLAALLITAAGAIEGTWRPPAPVIDRPVGRGGAVDASELAKQLLRAGLGLATAAAAAAAAACAASAAAGRLLGIGDNPCSGKTPIFFSGTDNRETTGNIQNAQLNDARPAVLTYAMGRAHTKWYNSTIDCNDAARAAFAGQNAGDTGVCDEYPFNSASQNQQNIATVTLRLVPSVEGPIQRDNLKNFYGSQCHVGDGGTFAVVPITVPVLVPSFGWCPRRS